MKLFEDGESWNWVDENNVVLGYRNQYHCCEDFGYLYHYDEPTESEPSPDEITPESLDNYVFNTGYHREILINDNHFDIHRAFVVMLVSKDGTDRSIYLKIYNHHNGYYDHGFEFSDGENVIEGGSL